MRRFWWVRHAPTHQKSFVGWRDVPADLSALPALERLRDFLPANAAVISSDLIRARMTADAIAGARLRLADLPGLREFNFGDWDGQHFSDVEKSHPYLSRAYWEDPGDHAPPNGESWNSAAARINAEVDRLLATTTTDLILVAHFGVILTQFQRANACTAYQALSQAIDNLSVTCLTHDATGWQVELVNQIL